MTGTRTMTPRLILAAMEKMRVMERTTMTAGWLPRHLIPVHALRSLCIEPRQTSLTKECTTADMDHLRTSRYRGVPHGASA